MAPPSDRQLRIIKRTIVKVKDEIEELLKKPLDTEVLTQVQVLFDSNVRIGVDQFEQAANDFFVLIDEKSKEDLELEAKVINDQSEVRKINSVLQAKIKKLETQLRGEESRKSIVPNGNSTFIDASSKPAEQPKLKKIEIPEFDGDLSRFFNFKALFTNLVHNNPDFSNVQKLYYLKQALTGKAAIVLQDCDLAEDAYPEAWAYFLNRFESKRAITRNFFVKLTNLQPIRSEAGIRHMLDQVMAIIRGLKVAGEHVDESFSRYIAFLVCSKLDGATAKDWENYTCTEVQYPKFEDLFKFLQGRTFVAEERMPEKSKESKETSSQRTVAPKKSFSASSVTSSKKRCPMCRGQHYLNQCDGFKALSAHRRFDFVKSQQRCLVCFAKDHAAASCNSEYRCKCGKPHHSLLHFDVKGDAAENTGKGAPNTKESTTNALVNEASAKKVYSTVVKNGELVEKVVLLPSAVVRFNSGKTNGTIRILLDSCAQATMISDRLVRRYRLPMEDSHSSSLLGGIGPGVVSADKFVRLNLISRSECFQLEVEAEVVPPDAMNYRMFTEIDKETMDRLTKFQLADPALTKRPVKISEVDMIIGAEYYGKCIEDRSEQIGELFLKLSRFGWTVSGPVVAQAPKKKFSGLTLRAIEGSLKNYHRSESMPLTGTASKMEVQKFVEHFEATYEFADDDKFNLSMPLKMEKERVSNNREIALVSLYRMERKLDPVLQAAYVKFMREYFALGHGSVAQPSKKGYFIPHRCVLRPESLTTPVRVVFNASSKKKGELSLNQALMAGPQIQRELFDILVSVRTYCFVYTADVEKMYRMIWVKEEDRDMQRILWRESPNEPVREYRLNTVTYGTVSASFMATYCLEIIAREIESDHPEAAELIRRNFYMDDLIAGGSNFQQVKNNLMIVNRALAHRGFHLRKYSANVPELLSELPKEAILNGADVHLSDEVGMLGIAWSPQDDVFKSKVTVPLELEGQVVTKRIMMSVLAKTFDPLGIVSPVTIRGKLMIQALWREGLDWDVPVSGNAESEFRTYLAELSEMKSFNVCRFVGLVGAKLQIVGFCDASTRAYCAMIFVRAVESNVVRSCKLMCAKTRVAPTKEMTIPKMELNAAVLLAQLVDRVRKNSNVNVEDCFLFTDATIVLCWLSHSADEWKTFVSNRVEKIKCIIPYENWFYVHTSQNPADLATRGLSVAEFLDSELWLSGPGFLKDVPICSDPIPNWDLSEALERRKGKVFCVSRLATVDLFIDKFSSFSAMLRVLAYVIQFFDRHRSDKVEIVLSAAELDNAQNYAIRLVQRFYFSEDIVRLSSKTALKANSKLLPLTPFLDSFSILRVGGRLERSSLSTSRKHPIILPAKAHFTRSMLRFVHEKYFHAGVRFLMGFVASRFWLVGGCRNLVKMVVRQCVRCTRFKGESVSQIMGQLPPFRVDASRPFEHTGVDLAGPFQCRCVAHRTTRYYKVYIAIFVCMVVKCVHIEVVTDLSSAKFIEALQRFIARRGVPSHLYSDNGTNFVGAKNLIIENQQRVSSFVAAEGISWSMIPPRSPNFGGLWESAVRSAKFHFDRVNAGNVLAYDEYCTMATRVEAILNSRPLCLTVAQGDTILTPAHFLVGQSLLEAPVLSSVNGTKPLSARLRELNSRVASFWHGWRVDYLNQMQKRYRWQRELPSLHVGQVVLLKDECRPGEWPLALVEAVYPDSKGVVRVVDLRVAGNPHVFRRAISKIVLLPIDVTPEPLLGSAGGVCLRPALDRCSFPLF